MITNQEKNELFARTQCILAGVDFVGIQEFRGMPLVYFNCSAHKSTLGLFIHDGFSVDAIRDSVRKSILNYQLKK